MNNNLGKNGVNCRACSCLRWALAGMTVFLVVVIAFFFRSQRFLTVHRSSGGDVDAVVLLTGELGERVFGAYEAYRKYNARWIIVSGFGDEYVARERLLLLNVPRTAILIENRSTSTQTNARFSCPIMRQHGIQKAIIVTSWFHSRRALRTFEHYAPEIRFYSSPVYHSAILPLPPSPGALLPVANEWLKIFLYHVIYRIPMTNHA
jgi:uncharacterized SAM-binding protein YcdF (DUF218 family)